MNAGLYRPGEFKDNCGFGLIAHMEGNTSHELAKNCDSIFDMYDTPPVVLPPMEKPVMAVVLLIQKPDAFLRNESH